MNKDNTKTGRTGKHNKVLRKIVVDGIDYYFMRKIGSFTVYKDKKFWFDIEADRPGEIALEIKSKLKKENEIK